MKKTKMLWLMLCLALGIALCLCVSCNGDDTPAEDKTYTVDVKDADGNPMADVMVSLLKDGESQGMKRLVEGKATFTLPADNYTVSLTFPSGGTNYWYDEQTGALTAEKISTTLVLYPVPSEKEEIWAPDANGGNHQPCDAYFVTEGQFHVALQQGRSYFLFHPTRAGAYRISAGEGVSVGYYGGTFNVLPSNMGDMENGALVMDVQAGHIGNTFVIGLDGTGATLLTVERTGDPTPSIDYDPYTIVLDTRHKEYFADCVNWGYEGFVLFDITSSHTAVYNETDGYYHLDSADGSLLFIDLKTDREDGFVASFKTICKSAPVSARIYDENGNYTHKESYSELFAQNHFEIVPLSAELARAVQNFGRAQGWYDKDGNNYLFGGVPNAKQELLWLYACGYYTEEPTARDEGSEADPVTLSSLGSNVRLEAGESVFFTAGANAEVFIKGASSGLTVRCGNKTYTANAQGVITFTLPLGQTVFSIVLGDGSVTDFFTVYEGDPDAIGGR